MGTEVIEIARTVRFVPCVEFASDAEDVELCVGCGWSADDHDAFDVAA